SRFRLLELTAEEPYLQAIVELLPEDSPASEDLAPVVDNVGRLFQTYWDHLFELAGRRPAQLTLASDPRELSYQVASTLQIDRREKQQLLEIETVEERLREEIAILRNQNEALDRLLRERATPEPPPSPYRFSVN
ncbi:MAG TPA: LON peptidase substrate-binding domain-containing protein, partial [Dehalococcoidia bacterium]|nr:LON peptidase substrate-binding domain-containing protein [Dehalococcoidia bacterium]